jgi:ferredoxin-NADP reductase
VKLRLRRMGWEAEGVLSLELAPLPGETLPGFTPGAHIDLAIPGVPMRQYSLCGDPADASVWRLAVREVFGGRTSRFIHAALRPGALLEASAPRNNFPLIDSKAYLFIAGGIGITPLLPMMRAAQRAGATWRLQYCVRQAEDAAFLPEIASLGGQVEVHESGRGSRLDVTAMLREVPADTLLYCCGPESLMLAVEQATTHWPAGSVRFEWFAPRQQSGDGVGGSFELVAARSGLTLTVAPAQSVLQALRDAGIDIASSCEQGVCGTCECRVLEGEVEHRDSILSAAERATSEVMMSCVSRARSARLVLDI